MAISWKHASYLIKVLASQAEQFPKGTVRVAFTNTMEIPKKRRLRWTPGTKKHGQKTGDIMHRMRNAEPRAMSGPRTDMLRSLELVLNEHIEQCSSEKGGKRLTVLVLTDGLWPMGVRGGDIEMLNERLAREVLAPSEKTEWPLKINFIRFGYDPKATRRLKRLCDHLKDRGV